MPFIMAAESGGNIVWFTYTGADGEVINEEATHIIVDKDCTVVRAGVFREHPNIVEVIFNEDVEKIERNAFRGCPSLRRVIMRGVKIVEQDAFMSCHALEYVECDKLEIVGRGAFGWCDSLRSINLPSARIVDGFAFRSCDALTYVKFGNKLGRIKEFAFHNCRSLERITIPLKDGLITRVNIFQGCVNLRHADLIEGELHETIAALHMEEWRNDMNEEIDSIHQILPDLNPGGWDGSDVGDPGEKSQAIRGWIRSVLRKITHYQAEHRRLLEEDVANTLVLVLPNNDIVVKCVLPFLELPPYTFEVWGDDDEDDSDEDTDSSDNEE